MSALRALLVLGTRPEVIKLAPVYWALRGEVANIGDSLRSGRAPTRGACRKDFPHSASLSHQEIGQEGPPFSMPTLANSKASDTGCWDALPVVSTPRLSVEPLVVFSGQHPRMVEPLLQYFGLPAHLRCEVFTPGQSLAELSARLLEELDRAVGRLRPDCVVVQGDTATAWAAALVAHQRQIPLVHVEAGLRSGDLRAPWPEEAYRRMIDVVADLWCAPTKRARQCLLNEGADPSRVYLTGNTVIDSLLASVVRERREPSFDVAKYAMLDDRPLVLVTCHRRENLSGGLAKLCVAVQILAEQLADHQFVWLLHPNPRSRTVPQRMLAGETNVHLLEPVTYGELVWLLDRSALVISDSGGLQEEAPSLGKPIVVARQTTERPEAVEMGAAVLAGTSPRRIVETASRLLCKGPAGSSWTVKNNPFGDGRAGERIAALIANRAWTATMPVQPQPRQQPFPTRYAA